MVGTWEWSGAGCRDASLSESSHVTEALPGGESSYIEYLIFNANGSAAVHHSDDRVVVTEIPYTVVGNEVAISTIGSVPGFKLRFNVVDGDLVHNFNQMVMNLGGSLESLESLCPPDKVYVFVYSKID